VKQVERPKQPQAGAEAYDFELTDLQGNTVSLSDFRGKKVLLNFWATWCGPCRAEIPHMTRLYGELRDEDFEIVAVNLREDAAKVATFAEQFDMTFPVLLDPTGRVGSAYYVRGIPTSIFLDEQGVIQTVHVGTLTDEMLRAYVDQLMQ
jgi:thiol-disulfide isomerase/thioredoxin